MYNNRTIKPFKGQLISLSFISKHKHKHTITGEITASDRDGILFNINKLKKSESLHSLHISYEKIISIQKPEKI